MYLQQDRQTVERRRGVILLVVLALLTLFAVVGVSFVLYSQRQADAARVYREAQLVPWGVPPDGLLDEFLRQWIYDVEDLPPLGQTVVPGPTYAQPGDPGITSSLRGLSLARTMFGHNQSPPGTNNLMAYNGL